MAFGQCRDSWFKSEDITREIFIYFSIQSISPPPPPNGVVTLDVGYPVKNVSGVGRKKTKHRYFGLLSLNRCKFLFSYGMTKVVGSTSQKRNGSCWRGSLSPVKTIKRRRRLTQRGVGRYINESVRRTGARRGDGEMDNSVKWRDSGGGGFNQAGSHNDRLSGQCGAVNRPD